MMEVTWKCYCGETLRLKYPVRSASKFQKVPCPSCGKLFQSMLGTPLEYYRVDENGRPHEIGAPRVRLLRLSA
jgi:transposase-like protein